MIKRFNDTGVCIPEKHYMVDNRDKISSILQMVDHGDYFVINKPRQFGKTTILYLLNRELKKNTRYFPIKMSFEAMGSASYESETVFVEALLLRFKRIFQVAGNQELLQLMDAAGNVDSINKLDIFFSQLTAKIDRKVVLMIDEVDKSSNNQLFLDFLGLLRDKYLKYSEDEDQTFHSVILAGVHDIKSLKVKLRAEAEGKYNSPWNIAADFKIDLAFSVDEIAGMLTAYSTHSGIALDIPFFSRQLYYLTSGYPFLVSYLCKIIHEEIVPAGNRQKWEPGDMEEALKLTLKRNNTNFQSLVKNLENNPQLYDMVFQLIMNERQFSYNPRNPIINIGTIYGVLKEDKNKVCILNRIYEQLIYDYMASKIETSKIMKGTGVSLIADSYIREDGALDIEKVIKKFQKFMQQQYSKKDLAFIERNGRLLFLAFIKPIINGKGFDFKEVEISEENRLDVVITFENRKFIVELKIWRGEKYHQAGVKQLCRYLGSQHQDKGYLLIYDLRKEINKAGHSETLEIENKKIFVAWV